MIDTRLCPIEGQVPHEVKTPAGVVRVVVIDVNLIAPKPARARLSFGSVLFVLSVLAFVLAAYKNELAKRFPRGAV